MSDEGMRPVGGDPDHPDADAGFDPQIQDAVSAALGSWARSLDAEPYEPMPERTWEQIRDGVEAARWSAEFSEQSVTRTRRMLPGSKWTTPLVAASVVGLALVVGSTVLGNRTSPDVPVVAADNVEVAPDAQSEAVLAEAPVAAEASPRIVQAGFIPPAKKVMDLGEDLTSTDLADTVDEILAEAGVDEPMDVLEMPEEDWEPSADGMTSDPKVLRDCVTKVTKVETSQALLVLRASVNGVEAGVVVVPEFMVDMNKMQGMDAEKMRRMGRGMGVTTIYVVEPTCGMGAPEHDPTLLRVAFTLAP